MISMRHILPVVLFPVFCANAQAVEPVAAPALEVVVTSSFPSGVALLGEPGRYVIQVKNPTPTQTSATLQLTAQYPGEPVWVSREWPVNLGSNESGEFAWEAPTDLTGYSALSAVVRGNGRELGRSESALLVVNPPAENEPPASRSFFGTMFVRDAKAAARIGVRVERRQAVWAWLQPTGPDKWNWNSIDGGIRDRAEQGIATILTIRPEIHPGWTKWKSVEELASPEHLPEFKEFVREVVSRYKDRILAVEIVNEPDLEVVRDAPGKIPATEVYARILKAGYEASKSVAPDLPVIGLDVSGVDFPRLQFSRSVLSLNSGYMDIFGGHPYAHSRYMGGDALPISPLKMDTAGRMRAMAALMREHGLPPRIWSTEFGWALHLDEPLSSPSARLFAAYTAQAILLSRSVPEVEKLFWFAATVPGRERSSSYGMFRKVDERANYNRADGNWYPSPSAAAYATCARLLDDVTFVRQFTIGPFCHVLRFTNERTGETVMALWMEETASVGGGATLRLPASAPGNGRIIDALGGETPFSSTFDLEPLPVFIVVPAADADRLEQSFRTATVEARERIVVQGAHVTRLDQISLDVINNDLRPAAVKVFQSDQTQSARSRVLEPGVNTLTIPAAGLVMDRAGRASLIILDERTSATVTTEIHHNLRSLHRIDLQAGSLESSLRRIATPIALTLRDHVLPADPGVDWKGAEDLSLTAWAGWTPAGIALLVHVRDDIHSGPPPGVTNLWDFDSLQVAFDPSNRAGHGYDDHCREFSFALNNAGAPELVDNGGVKIPFSSGNLRIWREGVLTCYEMIFPW
ncbi:MAG: hypothetical protein ABII82_20715, partial [Verrucomicrobiota bacterium]